MSPPITCWEYSRRKNSPRLLNGSCSRWSGSILILYSILQASGTAPTGSRPFSAIFQSHTQNPVFIGLLAGKPYIFLAASPKVWHYQIAQKTPGALAPTGFAGWCDPGVGRKSHTPFNQHRNRATDSCGEGAQVCRNRQRKKGRNGLQSGLKRVRIQDPAGKGKQPWRCAMAVASGHIQMTCCRKSPILLAASSCIWAVT